jgi:PAS domain S-box-containing protein
VDLSKGGGHFQSWVPYYNMAMRTAVFVVVAVLISMMKELNEHLEQRVEERTAELQAEISDRLRAQEELRASELSLRQFAENIREIFWMTDPEKKQILYVSPAYEQIWGRDLQGLYAAPRSWLDAVHPADRPRVDAAISKQTSGGFDEEYRIVRPDGSLRWIRDRAFPVRNQHAVIYRIAGIAEDITKQKQLEKQILEISDREQARIGHDLHDGLCQLLVSTAFDCNSLERRLAELNLPETKQAQQIGLLLDRAITEARQLARGLYPVKLEADGLTSALEELAMHISARARINCQVESPESVSVRDNVLATQLYRIAQEAVNNALKHGQARRICIRVGASEQKLELSVTDDGLGIDAVEDSNGMGLHIMKYRARTIGGTLQISRNEQAGTTVSCCVQGGPF